MQAIYVWWINLNLKLVKLPAPLLPPPPQFIQLLTVNDWSQFKKTLELKLGKWRGINDSAVDFDWGESSEKE